MCLTQIPHESMYLKILLSAACRFSPVATPGTRGVAGDSLILLFGLPLCVS